MHCHAYACWRREGDSNPRYGLKPYNGLANRRLQPLGHPSIKQPKNTYSALLPLSMRRARQNPSSHGINSHKSEGGSPFDTIEVHAQPRIRSDKLRKTTAGSSTLPGIQRIIFFGGIYSACSSKKAGKKNELLNSDRNAPPSSQSRHEIGKFRRFFPEPS